MNFEEIICKLVIFGTYDHLFLSWTLFSLILAF